MSGMQENLTQDECGDHNYHHFDHENCHDDHENIGFVLLMIKIIIIIIILIMM